MSMARRRFLVLTPLVALGPTLARAPIPPPPPAPEPKVPGTFPAHDPDLAREMVGVSHRDPARVRELLAGRPALANATWDWGWGDWESALGAASHVGNREIATLLLAAGARPSIFSAAMLGQLAVVKAFVAASPGIQQTRGPHGISLLAHATAGGAGAVEVAKYLEALGDADPRYTNEPLAEADLAAIVGTYAFGPAATERLTVATGELGPAIEREGRSRNLLFHLGQRVFHPPGAEAVRIRFGPGERALAVTLEDGPVVVTATRIGV
jgi:hypothetical protein